MVTKERAELKKTTWLHTLTLSDAVPRPVEYGVGGFRPVGTRNSKTTVHRQATWCTGGEHALLPHACSHQSVHT